MRTPLAWKNLTSNWSKCALAATGVGFAVFLMFMQIGFQRALIDNNVRVMTLFNPNVANLAVSSKARYNVSTEQRFSRKLFELASAFPGIEEACTVSMERGTARVKVEGRPTKPVRVVAIELCNPEFFADAELYQQLSDADSNGAAIVDSRSKSFYHFASTPEELQQQWVELNSKEIPLVGKFSLGTDFGNDGTLLMSERIHGKYFPWRNPFGQARDVVDIGFLRASTNDPEELASIAAQIEALAPSQIQVKPTAVMIQDEKRFWERQTPVGKIFLIGTIMGLLVGAIICYQIQFTDITEHMPEFATLKAMGYSPGYFWSLILCQSFYLACLGFVPGMVCAIGMYQLLSHYSGLIMEMDLIRIAVVFGLTLLMCVVSGALAIRKLFGADPASLF